MPGKPGRGGIPAAPGGGKGMPPGSGGGKGRFPGPPFMGKGGRGGRFVPAGGAVAC